MLLKINLSQYWENNIAFAVKAIRKSLKWFFNCINIDTNYLYENQTVICLTHTFPTLFRIVWFQTSLNVESKTEEFLFKEGNNFLGMWMVNRYGLRKQSEDNQYISLNISHQCGGGGQQRSSCLTRRTPMSGNNLPLPTRVHLRSS